MSWVTLTILAVFLWSITNIIDKYVLSKLTRNPFLPLIILGLMGLIASGLVYLYVGFDSLSFWNTFLVLFAGALYLAALAFYFFAVKTEEISRIVPLFGLTPLFVALLAAVFLGELFPPIKYLGMGLLVVGAILISSKGRINLRFSKGFWFMIVSVLIFAVQVVLSKHLLNLTDFWTVFAYTRIGAAITLIPIVFINFSDLKKMIRKHGQKSFWTIAGSESIGLVGVLLITIAMAIGTVTLVTALSEVQPFFILLFTVIFSIWFPKILKEELSVKIVLQKLVAIIIMFVGVLLVI